MHNEHPSAPGVGFLASLVRQAIAPSLVLRPRKVYSSETPRTNSRPAAWEAPAETRIADRANETGADERHHSGRVESVLRVADSARVVRPADEPRDVTMVPMTSLPLRPRQGTQDTADKQDAPDVTAVPSVVSSAAEAPSARVAGVHPSRPSIAPHESFDSTALPVVAPVRPRRDLVTQDSHAEHVRHAPADADAGAERAPAPQPSSNDVTHAQAPSSRDERATAAPAIAPRPTEASRANVRAVDEVGMRRVVAAGPAAPQRVVPRMMTAIRERDDRSVGDGERAVHITIGRVEIRAIAAPAPASPVKRTATSKPAMTLHDYLQGRAGGRR